MFPVRDVRILLWIHGLYPERFHRPANHFPAHSQDMVTQEHLPDTPLSEVGRPRIYLIDEVEDIQRNLASSRRGVRIRSFPAYHEQFGLPPHTEDVLPKDTGLPLFSIQGARQIFFEPVAFERELAYLLFEFPDVNLLFEDLRVFLPRIFERLGIAGEESLFPFRKHRWGYLVFGSHFGERSLTLPERSSSTTFVFKGSGIPVSVIS